MAIPCPNFIASEKAAMEAGLLLPSSSLFQVILTQDDLKKIATYKAVEYVEFGMVLGLETGSTAKHAVDRIGELLRQGKLKDIVGIPTSKNNTTKSAGCELRGGRRAWIGGAASCEAARRWTLLQAEMARRMVVLRRVENAGPAAVSLFSVLPRWIE